MVRSEKQWLKQHVVSYTFILDEFQPNPDSNLFELMQTGTTYNNSSTAQLPSAAAAGQGNAINQAIAATQIEVNRAAAVRLSYEEGVEQEDDAEQDEEDAYGDEEYDGAEQEQDYGESKKKLQLQQQQQV